MDHDHDHDHCNDPSHRHHHHHDHASSAHLSVANRFIELANTVMQEGVDPEAVGVAMTHAAANFTAFAAAIAGAIAGADRLGAWSIAHANAGDGEGAATVRACLEAALAGPKHRRAGMAGGRHTRAHTRRRCATTPRQCVRRPC